MLKALKTVKFWKTIIIFGFPHTKISLKQYTNICKKYNLKKTVELNCFFQIHRPAEFNRFFLIDRCKAASVARNWTNCAPKQMWRPLPYLLFQSFFYAPEFRSTLQWHCGIRNSNLRYEYFGEFRKKWG